MQGDRAKGALGNAEEYISPGWPRERTVKIRRHKWISAQIGLNNELAADKQWTSLNRRLRPSKPSSFRARQPSQ